MKTKFNLDSLTFEGEGVIEIIGKKPNNNPYVTVRLGNSSKELNACIPDIDLERFAVNILKALKSKQTGK